MVVPRLVQEPVSAPGSAVMESIDKLEEESGHIQKDTRAEEE